MTALSHRQILIVFSGLMLGMFLAALDQTIVGTALPTIVNSLHGLNHISWVVTAYLLDLDHLDPPLRQAVRPIRPQGALPGRHRHLPDRLGPLRSQPEHGRAHRLPGHPGTRRRGPDGPGHDHHRRRGLAPGPGPLPGVLRGHLRPRLGGRTPARRCLHRQPELAVDLLHQHPDRHRGPRRHLGRAQAAIPASGPPDRLPRGRPHAGRGDRRAVGDGVGGHPVRLGLAGHPRAVGHRAGLHRRLRAGGSGAAEPILPPGLFHIGIFRVSISVSFLLAMVMFGAIIYLPLYLQLVDGVSAMVSGLL